MKIGNYKISKFAPATPTICAACGRTGRPIPARSEARFVKQISPPVTIGVVHTGCARVRYAPGRGI